jgi:hypothetical protein
VSGQQLEDRFTRVAEALPDPPARPLGEIHARARRRRVWRRVTVAVAALPVLVLSGVVAVELLPSRVVPLIEPATPSQVSGLELADEAVWISPAVSDVEEAARLFAAAALGWDHPRIELGTVEPGPVWITMKAPEGGLVKALFAPYLQDGAWQILQVGTDIVLEQTFSPPGVTLTWVPAGAVFADLYVRVEGRNWHGRVDVDQLIDRAVALTEFGGPSERSIVSMLVVLRDRDGQVLTAAGGHFGEPPAIPAPSPPAESSGGGHTYPSTRGLEIRTRN